jgi:hypothetical protein
MICLMDVSIILFRHLFIDDHMTFFILDVYFRLEEMRIYVKQNFNMNIFGKHF